MEIIIIFIWILYWFFFSSEGKRKRFKKRYPSFYDFLVMIVKWIKKEVEDAYSNNKEKHTNKYVDYSLLEAEMVDVLKNYKKHPNQKLVSENMYELFQKYKIHTNPQLMQELYKKANEKYESFIREKEKIEHEATIQTESFKKQKLTYKKPVKRPFRKLKNDSNYAESFGLKSIWDDYESVIDIMEKDKN